MIFRIFKKETGKKVRITKQLILIEFISVFKIEIKMRKTLKKIIYEVLYKK